MSTKKTKYKGPAVDRTGITLRERTIATLRDAILAFRYLPGDRLTERELCEWTGVSRTSIREALRQLEAEGLVQVKPYVGPIVATVSLEDARQMYELRACIEGFAVRLFTERATDKQIKKLARVIERYPKALELTPYDVIDVIDDMYDIIYEGCGNPFVADAMRSLRTRVRHVATAVGVGFSRSFTDQAIINYRNLIEAIERRDADGAETAAATQVKHLGMLITDILATGLPRLQARDDIDVGHASTVGDRTAR